MNREPLVRKCPVRPEPSEPGRLPAAQVANAATIPPSRPYHNLSPPSPTPLAPFASGISASEMDNVQPWTKEVTQMAVLRYVTWTIFVQRSCCPWERLSNLVPLSKISACRTLSQPNDNNSPSPPYLSFAPFVFALFYLVFNMGLIIYALLL